MNAIQKLQNFAAKAATGGAKKKKKKKNHVSSIMKEHVLLYLRY